MEGKHEGWLTEQEIFDVLNNSIVPTELVDKYFEGLKESGDPSVTSNVDRQELISTVRKITDIANAAIKRLVQAISEIPFDELLQAIIDYYAGSMQEFPVQDRERGKAPVYDRRTTKLRIRATHPPVKPIYRRPRNREYRKRGDPR